MNYQDPEERAVRRHKRIADAEKKEEMLKGRNSIACLNRIVKRLESEEYSPELLSELSDDTSYICEKMSITPTQSVLLAVIAEESSDSGSACMRDLSRAFGVTNLELVSLIKEIEDMSRKHIIRVSTNPHRKGASTFEVYADAMEAIVNDAAYSAPEYINIGTEEVFTQMRKLFSEYFDDALSGERLYEDLIALVENNPESIFCQKVNEQKISQNFNLVFFLYLCHRYGSHGMCSMDIDRLMMLVNPDLDTKRIERDIAHEALQIQKKGLVEFLSEDGMVDSSSLALSETVRKEFFTELKIEVEADTLPQCPDLKDHNLITEKELFYNAYEGEQMDRLSRLLQDENFKGVQQRLQEQGMRKGVNVIMYGPAGTGKTESCLQLARQTGRDLFMVDVSKLKSKWVGDSEKSIRGLFQFYKKLVQRSEKAPILLFNEADAIFGMRMKGAERAVEKMENSIQNIILQEMETLDGILIATTNLETNLDPAFERRFLFKIQFSLPEEEAREKIWQSMIPDLEKNDAKMLARQYPFSGGQIENVSRKSTIEYIIGGSKAGIDELTRYCDEERLGNKPAARRHIGFE